MDLGEDIYSRFNIFEDLQSLLTEVKKQLLQSPHSQMCLSHFPSLFWTHLPLLQLLWFFLEGSLLQINLDVSVVLIKALLSQLMAPFSSCREFCTNCQCFCLKVEFESALSITTEYTEWLGNRATHGSLLIFPAANVWWILPKLLIFIPQWLYSRITCLEHSLPWFTISVLLSSSTSVLPFSWRRWKKVTGVYMYLENSHAEFVKFHTWGNTASRAL